MTEASSVSAKSAIFLRISSPIGLSARQMSMSGEMPISRNLCAECWVGLVLSSPAASIKGT